MDIDWWGYRHTNGTIQVKRYFSRLDIQDARESPFCKEVVGPFHAESREEAISYIRNVLGLDT